MQAVFAGAAIAILAYILQLPLNAGALLLQASRGDGEWWLALMKNVVSPALAAYFAFTIVAHYYRATTWKTVACVALLIFLALTVWAGSYTYEVINLAGLSEEQIDILWGTLFSTAAAVGGGLAFVMGRLPKRA